MINLATLEPNKVSINLMQYSIIIGGDSGIGKTTTLDLILKSMSSGKAVPLFLEFENRFQNIPDVSAVKVDTMSDFKSIIAQLKNPALKEKYSCVVVDSLDKYEEFCEKYITENADAEILKDVGAYGEGQMRFKSSLRNLGTLQNLGYTVHFIAQATKNVDFDSKKESIDFKLNKNTLSYTREGAFLVGYLYLKTVNGKVERFLTFQKSEKHPNLKDTFGLPSEINVKDFKQVWLGTIEKMGGDLTTDQKTIDSSPKQEDFNAVKARGVELGGILAESGYLIEATAVLKKNIGTDENGNVKMFDSLHESQIELTKVIVMELDELATKFNLLKVQS